MMRKYKVTACGKQHEILCYSARQAIEKILRSIVGTRTTDKYIDEHGSLIVTVTKDVSAGL